MCTIADLTLKCLGMGHSFSKTIMDRQSQTAELASLGILVNIL